MVQHPLFARPRARSLFGASALVAGALLAFGCGSQAPEGTAGSREAIAGGTVDLSHHQVFLLISHSQDRGGLCTATLIAPNLLLTARHCVSPNRGEELVQCGDAMLGEPFPPSALLATNDAHPGQGSLLFRAAEVRVPQEGEDTCGYDIALVILKENVPPELSTPAVPRIDRDVTPGEPYTAVGYGELANGEPSGSRMQLPGLSVACEPGNCGDGIESTEFLGEKGICSGDSGGPALDRDGKVLGVVSRGGPGCSEPIYGAVAAWRELIVSTAAEAASLGGYEAPFWVRSGSSDPPVAVGSGGGGGGPSEPPHENEGKACHASGECGAGLVCYALEGSAVGSCTATCTTTSDCADGSTCKPVGSVSICASPSDSGDVAGSCALAAPRTPAGASAALLAAGLGLALWRRRPARARRA